MRRLRVAGWALAFSALVSGAVAQTPQPPVNTLSEVMAALPKKL